MHSFADKITHFRLLDLDDKHGTLSVWEDEDERARLVLFTVDETGKVYVLIDESTESSDSRLSGDVSAV
jgi:hypothetical protein